METREIEAKWRSRGTTPKLKEQGNSPQKTDEADLFSLKGTEFKKEIIKIPKELRKTVDKNADYCKKRTKNFKEEPRKIHFSKTAELKTVIAVQ